MSAWCRAPRLATGTPSLVSAAARLHPGCIHSKPQQAHGGSMTDTPHEYDDIPGTTVFDAQRSRQGYWLNQFCMSLMKADNRAAFKADESAYLAAFPMTPDQKQSI